MRPVKLIIALLLCVIVIAFTPFSTKEHWKPLFNGKDLSGWDTYIGPDLDDNGKPITGTPVGLNNDPRQVFTVVPDNGENVIRISGQNWGAIITKNEYENYHLQLQFKWGSLSWGQKKGKKKDSGLLYHSVGKYGADYGAWMRAQEFQIEEGNTGDYWGCAGGEADIPADKKSETDYIYDPRGTLLRFSQTSKQSRHCIKQGDAENPSGQWNTLDLYCHGDTSIHVVNGKVMMVLYHNQQSENGQDLPLTKGRIQLQSEGAELFYRHIQIRAIDHLPLELIKQ
ncbi:DUF1080 domain-containing protein [Mucilaginibacter sp. BT774]|uniref:3-keto-disaccharide hydrolase n=1 Tax=Mucilaginibacter sp. BT774 TaxID=3062276 RepID=UPI002674BBFF|nr:DUF1080 domain-containing protein [Mucilaginibacter sp. BT774]MDO3628469.1 DUF1080 domain-containing protein [Mucilaginibacter sp. BT774]